MQLPSGFLKFHCRVNLRNACIDSSTLEESEMGRWALLWLFFLLFVILCCLDPQLYLNFFLWVCKCTWRSQINPRKFWSYTFSSFECGLHYLKLLQWFSYLGLMWYTLLCIINLNIIVVCKTLHFIILCDLGVRQHKLNYQKSLKCTTHVNQWQPQGMTSCLQIFRGISRFDIVVVTICKEWQLCASSGGQVMVP